MKTLHDILKQSEQTYFSTDYGIDTHRKLQRVVIAPGNTVGNPILVQQISARPDLLPFFCESARTEVPIAGTINGRFISRRIDRMVVSTLDKTVSVIDYKTDTDKTINHNKYVTQICEYIDLLRAVYPNYTIAGYILWTHDFSLEKI